MSRIRGILATEESRHPEEDTMCQKVTCQRCGKPTWRGCGEHVEQALRDVPVAERCSCPR